MAEQSLKDKTVKGVSWRDIVTLKKYIFLFITVFAVLVIIDRYVPLFVRKYYHYSYKSLNVKNGEEFEESIRNATFNLIESESWGSKPLTSNKSLFQYLYKKLFGVNNIMGYGEYGYLMHYAFLYAEKQDDQEMMFLIKEKFDKYWLNDFSVARIDQASYGCVAIDLYLWSRQPKYKTIADNFFAHLDSIDHSDGMIIYTDSKIDQDVDAIGLVPPFLYYFSDVFKNNQAQLIASRMVEDFVKWGTDPITGIPCQKYDIKRHIKKKRVNWGRGTSWYLLGVQQLESDDTIVNDRIDLLDSTLINMDTYFFQQYLGEKGLPDMSATIPILFYLNSKGHIQLSKDQLANILSPYVDEDGIIRYGSPSISRPQEGVNVLLTNLFCQGLLLYFISEL